jgi:hypothetical protein
MENIGYMQIISKGFSWQSFNLTEFNVEQRYIVVRTEASKTRKVATVDRAVAKERELIENSIKRLQKKHFLHFYLEKA